jgi:hypothetical protein
MKQIAPFALMSGLSYRIIITAEYIDIWKTRKMTFYQRAHSIIISTAYAQNQH